MNAAQARDYHATALTTLAHRLRALRITAGLTQAQAAKAATVHGTTWRNWEQGRRTPQFTRAPEMAQALGVPLAALFAPDGFKAVADVVLSPDSVSRIRAGGAPVARELALSLAAQLEPLILQAATRQEPDVSPGARAKRRRSRLEVLAGVAAANLAIAQAKERRSATARIDTDT